MRLRLAAGTCLLAGAVSLTVSYVAHAYRTGQTPVSRDPLAELALSPAQRQKIRDVLRSVHPRLLAKQAAVESQRSVLAGLLASPEAVDHAAVAACLKQIQELEADRDREVVEGLLLLKPHLSAEQQIALFQLIELRHTKSLKIQ